MKRYLSIFVAFLLALPILAQQASAQTTLRQSTSRVVRIGPATEAANCRVPVTTLTLSGADEAEALKAAGAATTDISGATFAAVTGADGWYDLTLTTSHTDTVGDLTVVINDDSLICPIFARFQVVEEAVYDACCAASAAPLTAAQVGTEVDNSLTDIHLDHLFAVDYDPASKPGTATALLNELIENDGGAPRYTANALEQAPSGGGSADFTANERTAIKAILGVGNDNATPQDPSSGILDTIRDDSNELQTDWANGGRLDVILDARASQVSVDGLNDLSSAEAQSAASAAINSTLEQVARADAAIVNCTVNTANFAGSATTVACILTDRADNPITAASGDLEGRELLVLSGAQIYEGRFITDSTWDGANGELRLTLSRAMPGTLADAVTAIIR